MIRVGLALGSNLGDRIDNIIQSVRSLILSLKIDKSEMRFAPIYESKPANCPEGSPNFYNTVIEVQLNSDITPEILLQNIWEIEGSLGRESKKTRAINSPRPIDIDILYYGDSVINSINPDLIIPHPRMLERLFVLKPLNDISPSIVLPNQNKSVEHLLKNLVNISSENLEVVKNNKWESKL